MISSSTDDFSAVVLEFQAFRGVRNEYIVKEMCIRDRHTTAPEHTKNQFMVKETLFSVRMERW